MDKEEEPDDLHRPENLKVRDEWHHSLKYSTEQFDKNVLWVSAGGFTVAFVFVDKIVPLAQSLCIWLFIFSCVFFGVTILLALYSHYKAMQVDSWCINNYEMYVNDNDRFMHDFETKMSTKVKFLNIAQLWLLILAFLLLISFASINIFKMTSSQKPKETKVQIEQNRGNQVVVPLKPVITTKPDSNNSKGKK